MRTHVLKTWLAPFAALLAGTKPFEFRRDDRGFEVGDWLRLQEYDEGAGETTGREMRRRISYVLRGGEDAFGCPEGFAVLGLEPQLPEALAAIGGAALEVHCLQREFPTSFPAQRRAAIEVAEQQLSRLLEAGRRARVPSLRVIPDPACPPGVAIFRDIEGRECGRITGLALELR